jgi:uncharacterized protein
MKPAASPPGITFDDRLALFGYESALPLAIEETILEERDGATVYDVKYDALRQVQAGAYLVVPPGAGPFAGIVFVHPAPGSKATFLDESLIFARRGAVSLLIDAPWSERGMEGWGEVLANPDTAVAEHIRTVTGLRRGIDLLMQRPIVDPNRVGYVGHSIGALIGGVLSGVERRVKAYVLMSGTGSFSGVAALNMPSLNGEALDRYRRTLSLIDPINYVDNAAPSDLLFQFGLEDMFFPKGTLQEFSEIASEPKSVRWYDAGHFLNEEARRDRIEWLSARLALHEPE